MHDSLFYIMSNYRNKKLKISLLEQLNKFIEFIKFLYTLVLRLELSEVFEIRLEIDDMLLELFSLTPE